MPYNGGRAFDFFTKQVASRPALADPTYGLKQSVCREDPPIVLIIPAPVLSAGFIPGSGGETLLIAEPWEPTPLVFTPEHPVEPWEVVPAGVTPETTEPWAVPPAGTTPETTEDWEIPPGVVYSTEHTEPWEFPAAPVFTLSPPTEPWEPLLFTLEHAEPWES